MPSPPVAPTQSSTSVSARKRSSFATATSSARSRATSTAPTCTSPVCLWRTRAGRTLLAHCPDRYCRVDLEDVETAKRLSANDARKLQDFFHSRLQVNASGTRLLSAGWYWHPWDMVGHVALPRALEDPCHLDEFQIERRYVVEQSSACWQTEHRILVGASNEAAGDDAYASTTLPLRANGIAVYDVRERPPALALDAARARFAVVRRDEIVVVRLEP